MTVVAVLSIKCHRIVDRIVGILSVVASASQALETIKPGKGIYGTTNKIMVLNF